MPKHRFYLSPETWENDGPELCDEEAHHCRDVMRCKSGDQIFVFDGRGREAHAQIIRADKKSVSVTIGEQVPSPLLPARITLGQAIPKGKNMDLIIQKATELGAAKIVPLLTANTVVQLNDREKRKKQEKWQRVAVEACKQCGQNWLPEIELPKPVETYIDETTDEFRIVAAIDPQSKPLKEILSSINSSPDSVSLLIGPEGDFTREEVAHAVDAGFHPMSLGPIILRSETAAIYTVSVLAYELMNR